MTTTIGPQSVPRLARGVKFRRDDVRDAFVLLAPERVLRPDPVACEILKRVDGETTLTAIVDDLAAAFAAERARIETDVVAFLGDLAAKGLVEVRP